jgi:hypothetical protein
MKRFVLALFLIFMGSTLFAQGVQRFALVVGANDGGKERTRLRYAVTDAKAIRQVMEHLGGVEPENIRFMSQPGPFQLIGELKNIQSLLEKKKSPSGRVEFFFYYSGHADSRGILLEEERVEYSVLKRLISDIPADVRITILDSCSSGAITRLKGGKKRPPFVLDESMKMKGYAIITSSSHDEASQESDRIGSSFFTHYFVSGLRGAADMSQDGRVTLNEVYQFAFYQTLARTEKTLGGPQHPGYEIQMSGSGDVVLTDIRQTSAVLAFPEDMQGRISVRNQADVFVAELNKLQGKPVQLGLEPGTYRILLEKESGVYEAKVSLGDSPRLVRAGDMIRISKDAGIAKKGGGRPYREEGFEFQLAPQLEPNPEYGVIHSFTLNLTVGYSDRLDGAAIGSFNIVGERGEWLMMGLGNYVKGPFSGVQIASAFNYNKGEFSGVQASLFNYNDAHLGGVQGAAINYARSFEGVQDAFLNVSGNGNGVQLGIVNICRGDITGAQIGVVNITMGKAKGTQIGVFNYANESNAPIGIFNYIKKGQFHVNFWADETDFRNIGIKLGGTNVYTLFLFGVNGDRETATTGLGFGVHLPMGKFFWNIEALSQNYYELENDWRVYRNSDAGPDMLHRFRIGLGWNLTSFLALQAGFSYNVYVKQQGGISSEDWAPDSWSFSSGKAQGWPGFYVGIQVF